MQQNDDIIQIKQQSVAKMEVMKVWLKELREKKSMSQELVASKCGISRQYYGFIETGERGKKLPVPTAKKIAAVLGFDWERFYED